MTHLTYVQEIIPFTLLNISSSTLHSSSCSSFSAGSSSSSSTSSRSSSFLASASAFFLSSSSCSSFIFFSASFVTAQKSSPCFLATAGSSVMMMLSKIVPDFTCHKSNPILQTSSNLAIVLASSSLYSGLAISGCTQGPL